MSGAAQDCARRPSPFLWAIPAIDHHHIDLFRKFPGAGAWHGA
jgi:hypothetical protein